MKEDDALMRMVDSQIASRGITDERVLNAFRTVPREMFVPAAERHAAYQDTPLPIGKGQTISQPYIVAYMSEKLKLYGTEKVLEIGTGSGYQAAILGKLAKKVHTIEIVEVLFRRARRVLGVLGYDNVHVYHRDGYAGLPEQAPFDRIVLTAAAPKLPAPLVEQLAPGGLLLMPEGSPFDYQELVLFEKRDTGDPAKRTLVGVRFVPMTGRASRD